MHHVAIMRQSWRLIDKILLGEKTIESRWYKTRRAPWNGIAKGDTIFFKDSGKPVSAQATVSEVMQFELKDISDAEKIVKKYGKEICVVKKDPRTWDSKPKYCILIRLTNPKKVKPFTISKEGFGSAAAWLSVPDIHAIKIGHEVY